MRSFASDNNAGVDPRILAALGAANQGHAIGYGADEWTRRMEQAFREAFGPETRAYAVLTGTGANVLSLAALLEPHHAVLCAHNSHLWVDEGGAPERFLGAKLIPVRAKAGKLQVADLAAELQDPKDEHRAQPKLISVTQATEVGTLYSLAELAEIAAFAREHDFYLHMDGARLANAAVALNCSLAELVRGVDVLSFGATKNGLLCGEAVVFLRPGLDRRFKFLRKQGMQLISKMRFVSAQLEAYLSQQIWADNARHANAMAQYLAKAIVDIPGVELAFEVESNAVFVRLPTALIAPLQAHRYFYVWDERAAIARWMTAFDTQTDDIDDFVEVLRQLASQQTLPGPAPHSPPLHEVCP
ncbi:MAG: threonine aldolase [Candidatus Melainabacteria bacterium HGW-Melainabacteria-1]|nr:MAG: threonine aldolase [Candidatus Melainabacteria bacterium HGW-Melainabacteria-1]